MTQVWIVRNSDTDIHIFNRREHLEPSVRISYSTCQNVTVKAEYGPRNATFTIEGERKGQAFKEMVCADCFPVWTEPSHL